MKTVKINFGELVDAFVDYSTENKYFLDLEKAGQYGRHRFDGWFNRLGKRIGICLSLITANCGRFYEN